MSCFISITRFCSLPALVLCFLTSPIQAKSKEAELDIMMDVMRPFGLPLVIRFHNLRNNIFFNTASLDADGFEAVGNFFFMPIRYLFGGKNVTHLYTEGVNCEIKQAFTYEDHRLAKTILAIIVLPISQAIGTYFKGLAYLFPETRQRHHLINAEINRTKIAPNQTLYANLGLMPAYSNEVTPCLQHSRPSKVDGDHEILVQGLKDVCAILEKNTIIYWIDYGTCLGAYRYGGMIPWDHDIDIAIIEQDHDNVIQALQQLDPQKYKAQDWSSYKKPKTLLKVHIKETNALMDIYHYSFDKKNRTFTYNYTFEHSYLPKSWKKRDLLMIFPEPVDCLFPLKRATFDGMIVWAPNDTETFLKLRYGDNLEPSMVLDEKAQTYRKIEDHPYWKLD